MNESITQSGISKSADALHSKAGEVYPFIEAFVAKKEQEIAEIEQMVERYEKRRLMEERAYQSMSTLRRMLSGEKLGHRQAVEYNEYVRKPMEKVRALRREIENMRSYRNGSASAE